MTGEEDTMFGGVADEAAPEVIEEQVEVQAETPAETPEQPVEPVVEQPVVPEKPEPGFVPFAAVLDERDKRKALEAEMARIKAAQPTDEPQAIDPWSDLEGALSSQQAQFQKLLYQERLTNSQRFAVQQHGEEAVSAAVAWGMERCASDPHFNQMVMNNPDPVGFALQQFQREQIATTVDPAEFEKFKAWQAEAAKLQTAAPAAPSQPVIPPSSLASVPSASGNSTPPKPDPSEERLGGMF